MPPFCFQLDRQISAALNTAAKLDLFTTLNHRPQGKAFPAERACRAAAQASRSSGINLHHKKCSVAPDGISSRMRAPLRCATHRCSTCVDARARLVCPGDLLHWQPSRPPRAPRADHTAAPDMYGINCHRAVPLHLAPPSRTTLGHNRPHTAACSYSCSCCHRATCLSQVLLC